VASRRVWGQGGFFPGRGRERKRVEKKSAVFRGPGVWRGGNDSDRMKVVRPAGSKKDRGGGITGMGLSEE